MKSAGHILLSPRITEKAAYLSQQGAYVFNVDKSASKAEIAAAVREVYKVTPRKVTLVAIARKMVATRGTNRMGMTRGGKKAYVYLKSGDKIELA